MTDSVLTEGGSDSAEGGGRQGERERDREDQGRRGCPY